MVVDERTLKALDLNDLKSAFPPDIGVLELHVEDYVDSTGEPSLRVLVVIDEATDVENISGNVVGQLKSAIRESLRRHGITVFPYFKLAKPSELKEDDED